MIGEALMGIEFTPDSSAARFMSSYNEDTNSTQPGIADLRPPQTPGSEILGAALETPRFFHSAPSPLPSPPAPRVLVPPLPETPQQITNEYPEDSPLPPLTPFGQLPTPNRWPPLPSPIGQGFSPGMFIQTPPPQTGPENFAQEEAPLLPNEQLQAQHEPVPDINHFAGSPLNPLHTPEAGNVVNISVAPEEAPDITCRSKGRRTPLRDLAGLPAVRRRLFDLDIKDEETNEPKSTNSAEPNSDLPTSSAHFASQESGTNAAGLKARLSPPPPITVPGPSNTTPGGIYPIPQNPTPEIAALGDDSKFPNAALSSLSAPRRSVSVVKEKGAPKLSNQVRRQAHPIAQKRKKKSSAKPEVEEKRPVMSERASLVLAEMRRQMSEAKAGSAAGTDATVATGTDATNFLPYSSAVQGSQKSQKETERTVCHCKASQCIKRYCPCFATSNFCGEGCGCRNCENTSEYSSVVGRARRVLLERDPNAFVPRIRSTKRSSGRGRQTIRGCNCRKGCEKNYCICKENGLVCGVRCTCTGPQGCQNHDESKLEQVRQVIENAPRSGYPAASSQVPKAVKVRSTAYIEALIKDGSQDLAVKVGSDHVLQRHDAGQENAQNITTSPGNGPFDVLPTPTNPSLPNHRFFEEGTVTPVSKKRSMTFGNPWDGFKKIRVGDPDGNVLAELRQSSSRYEAYNYKTPPPKTSAHGRSFIGTPLTSRVLSGAAPANGSGTQLQGHGTESCVIQDDDNAVSHPSSSGRLSQVPRIFRYKFGSGKNAGSFSFKS